MELSAVIGFTGTVIQGLLLHPDNEHLLFPLGSTIVIRHIISRSQSFLQGHDQKISCITCSKDGSLIASGQQTHMGFQADVIVWDFASRQEIHRFKLHKVFIQSLDFSSCGRFLATLGGRDDMQLVVWELATEKAMCGSNVGHEPANQVKFFNNSDNKIVTVANNGFRVWEPNYEAKKLAYTDISLGNLRRTIQCVEIDENDSFAYAGTKTGDVIEFNLDRGIFKRVGPVRKLFSQGINCMKLLMNGDLLIGAGDGTLAKISTQNMQVKAQSQLLGPVTSISVTQDHTHFFCGSSLSNIYWVDCDVLNPELRNTCHYERINDIAFPHNYSELFATCSMNDIRIWNARNRQELLRIQVPNLECHSVGFTVDGRSIISGWSDGKIRAFLPQSGNLLYVINDAHNHGVTALTSTSDCQRIVSGGTEGEVRVWKIGRQTQSLEISMKEHKGRVWDIQVKSNNEMAVSASSDGSCIVWDLRSLTRHICLQQSTMFKQVLYHPDESQLITTGSDRKVSYWDIFDGQTIRMLDGSEEGEINALAITREGEHFLSGGEDHIVKLWKYDEGTVQYEGVGHSGAITKIAVAPDQRHIITCGSEGAIFIWEMPQDVYEARADHELPQRDEA